MGGMNRLVDTAGGRGGAGGCTALGWGCARVWTQPVSDGRVGRCTTDMISNHAKSYLAEVVVRREDLQEVRPCVSPRKYVYIYKSI